MRAELYFTSDGELTAMRRRGDAQEYISARIAIEDRGYSTPCWVWLRCLTEKGYARANIPGFGGNTRVHRASYEIHVGPIHPDLTIDHLCCVKCCVNPAHLEPVTNAENNRRASERRTHCKYGHELTDSKPGERSCKTCIRERHRAYMRVWAKANPPDRAKANEYMRAWRAKRKLEQV